MDGNFDGDLSLSFNSALNQPGTHKRSQELIKAWEKATGIPIDPSKAQVNFVPPSLNIETPEAWFRLDFSSGEWSSEKFKNRTEIHPSVSEIIPTEGVDKQRLKGNFDVFFGFEVDNKIPHSALVPLYILRNLEKHGGQPVVFCADKHTIEVRGFSKEEVDRMKAPWDNLISMHLKRPTYINASEFHNTEQFKTREKELRRNLRLGKIQKALPTILDGVELRNITLAQADYSLWEVAEIIELAGKGVHVGTNAQRRYHVIAREFCDSVGVFHNHSLALRSLNDQGQSEAISSYRNPKNPDDAVFLDDKNSVIERKIKTAFCPPGEDTLKDLSNNPVLQLARDIVFENKDSLIIERKFDGPLEVNSRDELINTYCNGEIHPVDLKNTVAKEMQEIISPIRERLYSSNIQNGN